MTSPTGLAWDECGDPDFDYFTVYGSAAPGLDSTAALIGYTTATVMDVTGHEYTYYHATATDFAGNEGDASAAENTYSGVNGPEGLPASYALIKSRPNPFTASTAICFDLPRPCVVRLEVADASGRVVRVLTNTEWAAGRHSLTWTGDNDAGEVAGPGVYFVRMEAGGFTASDKVLRMK